MLPGIVPLVTEAKWRGQHIVQIFQDGTGQHEKVQLHFWGFQGGEGSGDGASVTWNPHSPGRSHHQTLHSQGHLSAVLLNHLRVRHLSSSSFLCFAIKAKKKYYFKRYTLLNDYTCAAPRLISTKSIHWVTGWDKQHPLLNINNRSEFICERYKHKGTHFFLFLFFTK